MWKFLAVLLLLGLWSSEAFPQQGNAGAAASYRKHAVESEPYSSNHAISSTEDAAEDDTVESKPCAKGSGLGGGLRYYPCKAWTYVTSTTERAIAIFAGVLTLSTLLLWFFTMRAANAARGAAKHIPAVERAYIFIQPSEKAGFIGPGERTVALVEVQNFGPTPGFLETLYGEFSPTKPKGRKPRYDPTKGTKFAVDEVIGKFDVPTPLDQRFEAPGVEPIYFFGYVEYRDIFKRRHTSRFCALLKPIDGTSALAGERAWSNWD
jgi:hypothetical protein